MTQTFQSFIAFCDKNKDYAHHLEQLVPDADFFRISDIELAKNDSLASAIKLYDKVGFILISDNFLKSKECMYDILSLFDDVSKRDQFAFVVIDGIDKSGKPYVTDLSNINNVIQYMNHWQSAYDMLRVHLKNEEDEETSQESIDQLNILQNIAGSMGEFLRILRKDGLLKYTDLVANNLSMLRNHLEHADVVSEAILVEEEANILEDVVLESKKLFSENQTTNPIIQKIIKHEKVESKGKEPKQTKAIEDMDDQAQKVRSVLEKLKSIDNPVIQEDEIFDGLEDLDGVDQSDSSLGTFPFFEPIDEKIQAKKQSNLDLLALGKKLIKNGDFSQGVRVLDTFIKHHFEHPEVPSIRLLSAQLLVKKLHQFEKASEHLEILISNGRLVVESYELLAEIAEQNHNALSAKTFYEKIIALKPNSPKIHYKLGILCQNSKPVETKNCIEYFKKAVELNPKNVDGHFQLGKLYAAVGKNNKAIKHLSKVLNLNAHHPFAAFEKAIVFKAMNNTEMAFQYYQLACEINDEYLSDEYEEMFTDNWVIPEGNLLKKLSLQEQFPPSRRKYSRSLEIPESKNILKSRIDKTVLITGATSGIGKATAEKFAEAGYKIIMTGRRSDRLENLAKEFHSKYDTPIKYLAFDVRDRSFVMNLFDELEKEWQNVDILINNAGLALGLGPIHEGDLDQWETMIDTNLKGLLYMIRAVSPSMVRRKTGHIINIASIAGKEIYPNGNVYIATKHAVDALTKAARVDLSAHNIRVSQVAPGHVESTEFAEVRFSGNTEKAKIYEDFNPITSEDVADAIFYIATRAPHINIQDILMMGTQQANATTVHRTGRIFDDED